MTNTPDVLTEATADLTWTLILDITRRVSEGDRLVRRGGWKRWAFDFMLGTDLRGKQLGIVGMGRIGGAVARRAAAFGMRVVHFSPRAASERMPDVESMPLDRLLATSDVVSLHCPLTPGHAASHRSGGAGADEAVGVSRQHLARPHRRRSGARLGAEEPDDFRRRAGRVRERAHRASPELLALENVVLSPHLGSSTIETRIAMADLAARNVIAVLAGHAALTPVP